MQLDIIINEMKLVFGDLAYGIEHTNRVFSNALIIMNGESINGETRDIVSLAAILHDVGAITAQEKYGSMDGRYQEKEGPPIAMNILNKAKIPNAVSHRVCYIIGNHHTPTKIDGIDFQIVWEADSLENLLFSDGSKQPDTLLQKINDNFRTATGRRLALKNLGISENT
jgi:hypothetical protein